MCYVALQGKLRFPYDLEKIIDDWVLMGFLVGNDFIPHLPNMHIQQVCGPLGSLTHMMYYSAPLPPFFLHFVCILHSLLRLVLCACTFLTITLTCTLSITLSLHPLHPLLMITFTFPTSLSPLFYHHSPLFLHLPTVPPTILASPPSLSPLFPSSLSPLFPPSLSLLFPPSLSPSLLRMSFPTFIQCTRSYCQHWMVSCFREFKRPNNDVTMAS